MTRLASMLLVVLLTAAATGCSRSQPQTLASNQPSVARLTSIEETGRRLYLSVCAYCHGSAGDGFGVNAPNLPNPPANHTDTAYMSQFSDEELFQVVKFGGTAVGRTAYMPAWGQRFSDREIASLVVYLRVLSKTKSKHSVSQAVPTH